MILILISLSFYPITFGYTACFKNCLRTKVICRPGVLERQPSSNTEPPEQQPDPDER